MSKKFERVSPRAIAPHQGRVLKCSASVLLHCVSASGHCIVLLCIAVLCIAMLGYCYAVLCSVGLCIAGLCIVLLCIAVLLQGCAVQCYCIAGLCRAMHCVSAGLCYCSAVQCRAGRGGLCFAGRGNAGQCFASVHCRAVPCRAVLEDFSSKTPRIFSNFSGLLFFAFGVII